MKVVLTLLVALMGQPPQIMEAEAPSLEACFAVAKQFVEEKSKEIGEGQVAAGCTVMPGKDA